MTAVRIGALHFLNCKPMIFGLERSSASDVYTLSYHAPAENATLLANNELDVAIIPSMQYAVMENLRIVPNMAISARGAVGSVLLFCNKPVDQVRSIAVDARSRTSIALLTILCKELYKIEPEISRVDPDIEAMLASHDAAMVIGDDALFWDGKPFETHDLAEDWLTLTGLPFVFAFLAGRPEAVDDTILQLLNDSLREGLANTAKIAENHSSYFSRAQVEIGEKYLLHNVRFDFAAPEQDGLKLFYIKAWEHGIIEEVPHIRFYGEAD